MKCCFTLCALVSLLPTMPATAGAEKSAYKQGREHEARENYEDAYEDYLRANESQPTNVQYRAALTRTRFLAAAAKVHRAILLRQSGRLGEALSLLEVAVKIDPSSAIAIQELENTRWMIQHSGAKSEQAQPRSDHALSPDILDAQGPVKLGSIPNVPIALKLTEDVRVVYQTVGKLAGLNVLFDPDYVSRRINIELNGVTLQEALDLVALSPKRFGVP